MAIRHVWVQQTDIGGLRTWHLGGTLGETRCERSTLAMKSLPGAEWEQVLNPCPLCQKKQDADPVNLMATPSVAPTLATPRAEPTGAEPRIGKHARKE